jgi:hypothetical protein
MPRTIFMLLLGFIFILNHLDAQNLILNGGFEEHKGCPDNPGQIDLTYHWFSANAGTPDYFNDCSPGLDYGTEFNNKGGKLPHSGKAYAGLQFYYLNRNEYYEYLENLLDSTLIQGQLYCIQGFISQGHSSYALGDLGAVFSVTEISSNQTGKMKLPYIAMKAGDFLYDRDEWLCISGIYRAKGRERFVTIGNLSPGDNFWHIRTGTHTDSLFKSSYYFLDDFSLRAIKDSSECHCSDRSGMNR